MKVLVTGASGFIGNYVIEQLLEKKHQVIATSFNEVKAKGKSWYKYVTYISYDIHSEASENLFEKFLKPDLVIHLGWGSLSNFKSQEHIDTILPAHYRFLKNLILNGLKDLTCIGTCLEYGMQEGCLSEDMPSNPTIAYPIAKHQLYQQLILLKRDFDFSLKWVRLFYMYGKGQSEKSILSLLDKALENKEETFNMSLGEQVRDYLPVEDVAKNIITFALQRSVEGIINCSSNQPISIKQLVAEHLKLKQKNIKLNLGYYPYPDYEPFKFWGDNAKQLKIKANESN